MSANTLRIAIGALSLAAVTVAAEPLQINEAGFDNPATVYPEARAMASGSGSAFPWTVDEAGFDNPATVYPSSRAFTRISGSPFPWAVNEAGPYLAESAPMIDDLRLRTAGK